MTVIPAFEVLTLALAFSAVLGPIVGYAAYQHWVAGHVCPVAPDPMPRLSAEVNRQAAKSAVESRPWAETNHQSRPVQSVPMQRPGMHRVNNTR